MTIPVLTCHNCGESSGTDMTVHLCSGAVTCRRCCLAERLDELSPARRRALLARPEIADLVGGAQA